MNSNTGIAKSRVEGLKRGVAVGVRDGLRELKCEKECEWKGEVASGGKRLKLKNGEAICI